MTSAQRQMLNRFTLGDPLARVVTAHPTQRQAGGMNEHVTDQKRYQVVVCGRLGDQLAGTFDQLEVESRPGETSLTGSFTDQAQLHGLLDRLRDLGIKLISVNPVTR